MADFIEQTVTKTAVRNLAVPIADVSAFNTIVSGVIATNPFGCTGYDISGVPQDAVIKSREAYVAKVVYEDNEAKAVGNATAKCPTVVAFNTAVANILANAALATAMGGDAIRDTEGESYSATLKCHDPSGEIYYVSFTRDTVRISSYSDDAIVATVEAWADTVTALA
jgi:hypothetical protein